MLFMQETEILHPLIMYDANEKNSLEKTEKFGADILKYCVKGWGSFKRRTWCWS